MHRRRRPALVLGHRGYRARFPENTLLAFREAMKAGADGIECDLQKTRDGRFVVIHDPDTARVAQKALEVGSSSLEELRRLDYGSGEPLATLDELLGTLPRGTWLDLELKEETITAADCGAVADIVDASVTRERLMVSSFDARLLYPMRDRGFPVGLLVGEEAAAGGLLALAAALRRLRPQYVNLPIDMVGLLGVTRSTWLCRVLRLLGFSLLFWTVNTPGEARFALRFADWIVTDEVELILRTLGTRFTGV